MSTKNGQFNPVAQKPERSAKPAQLQSFNPNPINLRNIQSIIASTLESTFEEQATALKV